MKTTLALGTKVHILQPPHLPHPEQEGYICHVFGNFVTVTLIRGGQLTVSANSVTTLDLLRRQQIKRLSRIHKISVKAVTEIYESLKNTADYCERNLYRIPWVLPRLTCTFSSELSAGELIDGCGSGSGHGFGSGINQENTLLHNDLGKGVGDGLGCGHGHGDGCGEGTYTGFACSGMGIRDS